MSSPTPPRRPRGFAMMDLLGLVVGFALFFALQKPRTPAVIKSADWRTIASWVEWAFGRSITAVAVVLLPVVLGRRALDRDAPRPAEWFLIVVGALQLAAGLAYLREVLYWRLLSRIGGAIALGPLLVRVTPEGIGALAALAIFAGFVALRRNLAAWARAAALVLILVLLFWGPVSGLAWELKFAIASALAESSGPTAILLRIFAPGLAGLPEVFLLTLPAVAMLRGRREAGHRGHRRLEWVGSGLLAAVVAAWIFELIAEVATRPPFLGSTYAMLVYSLGSRAWILATLLIASYFVGRFGADFERLMRPDSPAGGSIPTTSTGS